jgi:hypothetical protein
MNDFMDKLGGRKFLGFLLILAIGTTVELVKASGLSATFASFLAGALTVFGAANAYVTTRAQADTSEAAPEVNLDPIVSKVTQLAEEQEKHAQVITTMGDNLVQTNKRIQVLLNLK